MRQALALLLLTAGIFVALEIWFGFHMAYSIALGTIVVMAIMISLTFLWLWQRRETPLALGMSFSWAGAASVLGWWWFFHVLHGPVVMNENGVLFVFLGLYFVGAVQHFVVMQRSMGIGIRVFVLPVLGAILVAAMVSLYG